MINFSLINLFIFSHNPVIKSQKKKKKKNSYKKEIVLFCYLQQTALMRIAQK